MSRPSINFLAQHFLIPNVEYSFALQIRDYRLLWGIFCGATSNMSEIPIYTPEDLDKQLDAIIRCEFYFSLLLLCVLYPLFFSCASHIKMRILSHSTTVFL